MWSKSSNIFIYHEQDLYIHYSVSAPKLCDTSSPVLCIRRFKMRKIKQLGQGHIVVKVKLIPLNLYPLLLKEKEEREKDKMVETDKGT